MPLCLNSLRLPCRRILKESRRASRVQLLLGTTFRYTFPSDDHELTTTTSGEEAVTGNTTAGGVYNDYGNDNDKDVEMIRRNCYSNKDNQDDAVHDDGTAVDVDIPVHGCATLPFFSSGTQGREDVIPAPMGVT